MNEEIYTYLPDPELDKTLIPCPKCGTEYNVPNIRRGPMILMFSKKAYRVICEAKGCYHKGRMASSIKKAIDNWNNQVKLGKLKQLRETAGLSQMALGDAAGIGYTTISKIEQGKQVPSEYIRSHLAAALGVEPSEI